jgi:uncharacterized Tic20 family protein
MENNPPQEFPSIPPVPVSPNTACGKDERMWAMFCHLSAFAGYIVPVPFASVIGPLIVWMIKREEYPLVSDQGKESVNFQISMAIYFVISLILVFVLIGFLLIGILVVFSAICVILASIKANDGVKYRYPLCIRFIK